MPLRVPVCTLTDATLCGYSSGFSNCIKGCGLHAVDCGVIYLYPRRENFKTLQASFPACLRVGCAVAGARPQGIASASQVTRMLFLLSQAFLYIPVLFRMSKFYLVPRCPFDAAALALIGDNHYICYENFK